MIRIALLACAAIASARVVRQTITYPEGYTAHRIGNKFYTESSACYQYGLCYSRNLITDDFKRFETISKPCGCGTVYEWGNGALLYSQSSYSTNGANWTSTTKYSPIRFYNERVWANPTNVLVAAGSPSACNLTLLFATDPRSPRDEWKNVTFPQFKQCQDFNNLALAFNGTYIVQNIPGILGTFKILNTGSLTWEDFDFGAQGTFSKVESCGPSCLMGIQYSDIYHLDNNAWRKVFHCSPEGNPRFLHYLRAGCSEGYCVLICYGRVHVGLATNNWDFHRVALPKGWSIELDAFISAFPTQAILSNSFGVAALTVTGGVSLTIVESSTIQGRPFALYYSSLTATNKTVITLFTTSTTYRYVSDGHWEEDSNNYILWGLIPCSPIVSVADGRCLYNVSNNSVRFHGSNEVFSISANVDLWEAALVSYTNHTFVFVGYTPNDTMIIYTSAEFAGTHTQLKTVIGVFKTNLDEKNAVTCANSEAVLIQTDLNGLHAFDGSELYELEGYLHMAAGGCVAIDDKTFFLCSYGFPYVLTDGGRKASSVFGARCMAGLGDSHGAYVVDENGNVLKILSASSDGDLNTQLVYSTFSPPAFVGSFAVVNETWLLGLDVYQYSQD